ncbi:uncharacterized protein [Periplaneta americana]|uniref:uncharacterized protein n=1 Tax=Periplaneta americana TaxID=6978 RepID=UPI0037E7637B
MMASLFVWISVPLSAIILLIQIQEGHNLSGTRSYSTFPQSLGRVKSNDILQFVDYIIQNGIPKVGVPKLDPLVFEETHLGYVDVPGIIELFWVDFKNVIIRNLGNFDRIPNPVTLNGLLPPWTIKFDFKYPNITANGDNINISIVVGDHIPFYGDGCFVINGSNLGFSGEIKLETNDAEFMFIPAMTLNISFGEMKVHIFNSLGLGDTRIALRVNTLIGDVIPEFIDNIEPYVLPKIISSVLNTINEFFVLYKITVPVLFECINDPGNENCPIF